MTPQERKRFKNKNNFKDGILKTKYFKQNNLLISPHVAGRCIRSENFTGNRISERPTSGTVIFSNFGRF
jgi:hypothetical protein